MLLNNEYEITYIHLKRKGASAAYALALRLSTGRYVQLVGSTDRLLRAPYEHCLDIARYHNPDVMFYKNTDNAADATTPFTYEGPMLGSTYMKGNTIQASKIGYMFEKSLIVSEEFNERIANKNEFLDHCGDQKPQKDRHCSGTGCNTCHHAHNEPQQQPDL